MLYSVTAKTAAHTVLRDMLHGGRLVLVDEYDTALVLFDLKTPCGEIDPATGALVLETDNPITTALGTGRVQTVWIQDADHETHLTMPIQPSHDLIPNAAAINVTLVVEGGTVELLHFTIG